MKTLNQFVRAQTDLLTGFQIYWMKENRKHEKDFPISLANNDEWFEQFMSYLQTRDEEKNIKNQA